ncbi:MAG: hypothetical protein U9N14_03675, partial [Pseudomonadota bacterium]|nr:hypothetical protein [Pseudomonadota bacterium]
MTQNPSHIVSLGRPARIWAVGAIHGEIDRLVRLHEQIGQQFCPGDRLVYLGNIIGRSGNPSEAVDTVLGFRRAVLALRGLAASDVVILRGCQEEIWHKALQIQFAPDPAGVLRWML